MAKIVFLNVPGHGHVNPTLPVVQELVRRGHEVVYYNTEDFRAKIESTGATMQAYPAAMPGAADMVHLLRDGNIARVTRMLFQASEYVVPFLLEELRREQPDILIHDSIALWGSICARLLNLPSIASISHFIFEGVKMQRTPQDILSMIRDALPLLPGILRSRWRLERTFGKGIFQTKHLLPVLGDLNILFTAENLHPRSTIIDGSFRFVGPSISLQTRQGPDFPFEQLVRRPLIYLSLGTIHYTHTEFFRVAFDAFRDHPGQFVLATGGQTKIGPIPANFVVRDFVPQLEILQRADAFVTHGGMNSIQEALYYGVPMVMVPQQMEQLFNARIVESHGAGVLLKHESAEALRRGVDQILQVSAYHEHVSEVRRGLVQTGGYLQAVDEIEAFVQHRQNSNARLTHPS